MQFDDGEEFDLGGEPRIESRFDGFYVVGNGMLIPVNTREEAQKVWLDEHKRWRDELNKKKEDWIKTHIDNKG